MTVLVGGVLYLLSGGYLAWLFESLAAPHVGTTWAVVLTILLVGLIIGGTASLIGGGELVALAPVGILAMSALIAGFLIARHDFSTSWLYLIATAVWVLSLLLVDDL